MTRTDDKRMKAMFLRITPLLAVSCFLSGLPAKAHAQERWLDPEVFDINRERPHSTYVPFPDGESALAGTDSSAFRLSLNGLWRFSWVRKPVGRPTDFFEIDFDDNGWGDIRIPSNWEIEGHGIPHYLDSGMLPGPPGYVDQEYNPVGSYRRTFVLPAHWDGMRVFLHFASVGSAVTVWVNGREVGYSQGSKVPTEFDITSHVHAGENLLAVEVFRWCDGSYLEDVDFWRLSGIERDVFLFATPSTHIHDFFTQAGLDSNYENGVLNVTASVRNHLNVGAEAAVAVELLDADNRVVFQDRKQVSAEAGSESSVEFATSIEASLNWTAETPHLYTLLLSVTDEEGDILQVLKHAIGFRTVEIRDGLLLVNGVVVTLRGTNRHEHNPSQGRYLTDSLMELDVRLMKQLNINAVRTSHYPNDPRFYQLADRYGLYVVDEAFVESNGTSFHPDTTLAGKPEWRAAHLDRMRRLVERDKNHASVIMWSLGNEAGDGENFVAMYDWTKQRDVGRPVVYEMAGLRAHTDVFFPMYARVYTLANYAAERRDRPLILSEYAHAMGNSIGNLIDYWDLIYSHEQLQGGFIWDWVDQGLPIERDGRTYWGFGGDFGPGRSGGNFCINGIVAPDRSLNPHASEVKKVYQPISVRLLDAMGGELEIVNRHDFIDLSGFILAWDVRAGDSVVTHGEIDDLDVPPQSTRQLQVSIPEIVPAPGVEYFLKVSFREDMPSWSYEAGHVVAWDQFRLPVYLDRAAVDVRKTAKVWRTTQDGQLRLRGEARDFEVAFDLESGELTTYRYKGVDLIQSGPVPNYWRPPNDNDYGNEMPTRQGAWRNAGRHRVVQRVEHWQNSDRDVEVFVTWLLPVGRSVHITKYHVFGNGEIVVTNTFTPGDIDIPDLPKMGMTLTLPRSLEHGRWFGRGPVESYADRKTGAAVGAYQMNVAEMGFSYIRPQENGNRTDVRWIGLANDAGIGLLAVGDSLLNASALLYEDEDLDEGDSKTGRHVFDLVPRDYIVLDLDHRQMGLGGDTSWGAVIHEQYRIPAMRYSCRIRLVPFGPEDSPLMELSVQRF